MFSSAIVKQSGTSLHVEHGNDSNLYVEFRMEPVHQTFKSEAEGRPIFEDVPYIEIMFAGDKTKKVDRPVTDEDKHRFNKQWEAFQRQEQHVESGTPITEWPPLTKSEALELKSLNIHTVEALAALPDSSLSWLGARTNRDKAKAYLERSKEGANESRLVAELAKRDADITALRNEIAALGDAKKIKKLTSTE